MSVDKSDPRLTAYACNELSPTEKAELEAELADDDAAAEELAEIQRTLQLLRSELTAAAPPKLEEPRRQEIEELAQAPRRKGARRLLWGTASAGALVAGAVLMLTSARPEPPTWQVVEPVAAPVSSAGSSSPETLELSPRWEEAAAPEAAAPEAAAPKLVPLRGLTGLGPSSESRAPVSGRKPASGATRRPSISAFRESELGGDEREDQPVAPKASPPSAAVEGVKAGEWDDNANYREFTRWLGTRPAPAAHHIDIRDRRFIVVRDRQGQGVPNCRVVIEDEFQRQTELTTLASGRAILFPRAEGLSGQELTARTSCGGGARKRFTLADSNHVVELKLEQQRSLPSRTIDVVFILDTTGSMNEEIEAVKATVGKVASALRGSQVDIRIGMVDYKDRGDAYVTRVLPLSGDLQGISREAARLSAGGGGDTPESANQALHVAVNQLAWGSGSFAKLAFLIGDAPPHLDYSPDYDYVLEAREAAHRGIQVFTVAASGMDTLGQVVWRQIAAYTGATNLFVLRGGAGPQSTGAGDPKSSCGGTQTAYTSGKLDELVLAKINGAIQALERDPMRIPGVLMDENAKPCADRISQ